MGMNAILKKSFLLPLVAALSFISNAAFAQISALPDGIELHHGDAQLSVRIVEDRIVDVSVRSGGKTTPRTLALAPEAVLRHPAKIERSQQGDTYTLKTAGLMVRIQKSAPFAMAFFDAAGRPLLRSADPFTEASSAGVVMRRSDHAALYGIYGSDWQTPDGPLTRGQGGKVAATSQGNSSAPFVFTTAYGLLVDSDGGEFTTADDAIAFAHGSRPDVEYFVIAGPPLQTIAALSRLAGTPPLPPRWTLGFMNSQWGSTQAEIEKIVAEYRHRQLPLDAFILDYDWKAWGEDDYGEWRWNSTAGAGSVGPNKFPDGASGEFARRMNEQGVKLAGILKPRILLTAAGEAKQPTAAAAYATAHHFWYPGEKPMADNFSGREAMDLDFNNPETRAWFWDHLRPAFRNGMVAWWNDEADEYRTTPMVFPRPANRPGATAPGAPGAPSTAASAAPAGPPAGFKMTPPSYFNNFQFLNMGRALYEGQRADSNQRVWSINRNFYLGASRYGYALWSGDIRSGFASMALQRMRMLAALNTGVLHWSMDVGGFAGHPNSENYARWMEFAAFVPIMRAHGGFNEKRQPWVYGPQAEEAARGALELRYSLLPYIYSYERLTTEGSASLVRPLFWQFPSDPQAAGLASEWMFGDALLVSPVVTEGAVSQSVYLPAGAWFDYATGRRYDGARTLQVPVDAKTWKDIPLFVRDGSILATQPVEQYVDQKPVSEITLDVFPSDAPAAFTVYDDDGGTYGYEKGQFLRQQIAARRAGKSTRVTIDAASGSYAGPLRTYLLRIHTPASRVTLDGKKLVSAKTAETGTAWNLGSDRFGPVVQLRIAAGAKTSSVVAVQ
jgi:alpha-glucosidase